MPRACAVVVALSLVACAPQGPSVRERRAADLDALVTAVTTLHPDPFGARPEASWRADVADVRARAASMSADEFRFAVATLTNLGDRNGHGGVFPTDQPPGVGVWPLRLYAFADGWYVVDARDASLRGARLLAIGGTPVEDVAAALAPMVPRDNPHSLRARLASYVVVPAFLRGAGLRDGPLTVVDAGGVTRDVTPPLVTPGEYAALAGLDVPQIPLGLPRPAYAPADAPWWHVRRGDALVVGFERVVGETPEGRTLRRFADRVRADVAARRPRVVVVDVRRNPGGDDHTALPLVTLLRELRSSGIAVRVLVSRATYSAAPLVLARLRGAVRFYGEPTGGGSSAFGNPSSQALPHSGIVFHVAGAAADAEGPPFAAIEPDVPVGVTWRDWRNGVDAVLDAALR
ncbi:MAG TPA: hypothetical protein VGX28_09230 [Frankiaceae bacterium]|nr:hypothetical protein [Frankiaceae bacterium]